MTRNATLTQAPRRSLVDSAIEQIRTQIESGAWRVGERIPKDEGGGFAGYDGYSMAEFYAQEQTAKAEEVKAKKAKADAKALSKAKKSKASEPATETEVNEEGGE